MTARRITSGEVLKYRNGFLIRGRYETHLSASSYFSLTKPAKLLGIEKVPTIRLEDLTEAEIRAYVIVGRCQTNANWLAKLRHR